jgi:PAS domain S-box-containing protein
MNYHDKTKNELIKELQKLQHEYDLLKTSYEIDITERKLAEEELPEPGIHDKELMELSRDVIFSLTPQGLFGSMNQAFGKITGWQVQEWVGKPFADLLHPKDIPLAAERFSNLMKGHTAQAVELRIRKKSGSYGYTEVLATPRMKKGMITGLLGIARDISKRKRLEEIMKKEEQELKLILDSSPIIIFYKDNEGKFIHVNKTFSEAINLPEEEFVGKTVFDLYSGEIAQSMTNDDQEVFKSGRPKLNIIEQYKSVSGLRWVRTDKIPIFDKDNIPVGLIGFAQDITEQQLAEDALRQSEMKMRTLFDILPTGVSILDAERNIVFINPALERILNMTRDGFIKGDYKSRKYLRPDGTQMPEEEYASVRAIREKREVYDVETGVVMEDGHVIWTNVTAAPVEFTDWKVVIITTDITQRKQAEVALYESEKRFRQLYQQAPLSYQSLNAEGYFVDVNQAWLNLFQYSHDEVIGRWFGDFLAPHEVEAFKQRFPRFITTGELHVDLEMVQSAGSVIIVHIDGKIGHDENGQFKQTHCILYNITEHKKAENALRLEKENFRHSLDDSPLGIRITTKEGNTIYTNKALLDMYGYNTLEELQKTRLKNRYTPESYKQAQQRKHRRKDDDLTDNNYEISIVRKNGEIRHLQVWRKEILWDGVRQFQVIYDDITDRKRAEEKIKEFRNYMDFFFRQSLEGIYFTAFDDPLLWNDSVDKEKALDYAHKHQIIINVNDAFLAQYGVSKEDVIGKPVSVLFEHDREQGRRGRRELFDKRQIHLVTNEKQKDGSEVWIEGEYICMYDDKGRITGTFGAQRNITDRIKAEEELKNSTKLLESLHMHLNEIRENERTLISREIHDQVGQSLTALKLDLNWMHKYIKTNREAAIKLGGMIELITNTIKDVQRISSDLRPGILDDLGLVAAIEWYCDEFEKRTGIKCRLIPDDSIYNDSQKNLVLFRVLQEAFTNIIRHANASSVTVKLHQTRKGITLTVQDNGIGIAGEKIESPKSLGLIGIRERIKQFGGMVNVSSGKVHGTKLTIFIPEKKNSI